MIEIQAPFRCPRCKSALEATDGLQCTGCGARYRVDDGIVDLRCGRLDYYFNPVPRDEMARLIEDAERQPWPSIVRRFLARVKDNPDWLDDLAVDGRYSWKLWLELPPDARFLDLGCGLGNLTKNMAPHVGQAFAMDLTWERLKFAQRRFQRFNADDRIVLVAGGDGAHLPFPDAHFDCVALSGVLEWIPDSISLGEGPWYARAVRMAMSIFGASNPRFMQIEFMKEIRRVLKPGGQLFVAIENRLNYEYFGSRPDHHTRLWFGSLLPRPLANLYSIVAKRHPYRTYTYSIAGLRSLFRAAGFADQEFLGFLDGYTLLSEILDLETGNADFWRPRRAAGLKNSIRRASYFVPAYGAIGTVAHRRSNSLLRRIVKAIESGLPGEQLPVTMESCRVTGDETAVLAGTAGTTQVLLRIACNAAAAQAQARHHGFLAGAAGSGHLAPLVPEPLAQGKIQNVPYFLETRREGRPLREALPASGRTALLADVTEVLRYMNPAGAGEPAAPMESAEFERLVERPLDATLQTVEDERLREEAGSAFRERLRRVPVRAGLVHGRFGVDSLFASGGKITGLSDWLDHDPAGVPIVDVIAYLLSVQRAFDRGAAPAHNVALLARDRWPVPEERRFFEESCVLLGFDPRYRLEFVLLHWLAAVKPRLAFLLSYDRRAISAEIEQVARELLRVV